MVPAHAWTDYVLLVPVEERSDLLYACVGFMQAPLIDAHISAIELKRPGVPQTNG